MKRFFLFLSIALFFFSLTTYEYYTSYVVYHENGHYTFMEFSGDIEVWQWRLSGLPFPLIILIESLLLFLATPWVIGKCYEQTYNKPMPLWSYFFIVLVTPFGMALSQGYFRQIPAVFLASLFLLLLLRKKWLSLPVGVATIIMHSTGIMLIGTIITAYLIKEKKHIYALLCVPIAILVSQFNLIPIPTYDLSLLTSYSNGWQYWNLWNIGSILGTIQILALKGLMPVMSIIYLMQPVITLVVTAILLVKNNKPVWVHGLLIMLFMPFVLGLFSTPALFRMALPFYAFFPLLITHKEN